MQGLLKPKNDYVFKKLFSGDNEILIDLINCVLEMPDDLKIDSVEVQNPDILPDEIRKKFIILDVRAVDISGNEYDIEMQVRKYEEYPKRTLYYLCRMYDDQLDKGEDYSMLCPVVGIHFLDYKQFPKHSGFYYRFRLRDTRYPELIFNDDISLHIFELPGIEKNITKHRTDNMMEWLYFFNHAHEQGDKTMREHYNNPAIHKAFDKLEALSANKNIRETAQKREKALKDEAMFLGEARRQVYFKVARKLLLKGNMSVEEIAEITEMSVEDISKINRNIQAH